MSFWDWRDEADGPLRPLFHSLPLESLRPAQPGPVARAFIWRLGAVICDTTMVHKSNHSFVIVTRTKINLPFWSLVAEPIAFFKTDATPLTSNTRASASSPNNFDRAVRLRKTMSSHCPLPFHPQPLQSCPWLPKSAARMLPKRTWPVHKKTHSMLHYFRIFSP